MKPEPKPVHDQMNDPAAALQFTFLRKRENALRSALDNFCPLL